MPAIERGTPMKSAKAKPLSLTALDRGIAVKPAQVKLFSLKDLAVEPWKNGGGITRTIASLNSRDGLATFDWRVSVAEITDSGPFSVFPGIDRIAVVLENGPLKLSENYVLGQVAPPRHLAPKLVPMEFSGDSELFADISGPAITNFNVMTRRGVAEAKVEVLEREGVLQIASPSIVFCVKSSWQLTIDNAPVCHPLGHHEGAIMFGQQAIHARCLSGDGSLIVVHLVE
jgi:uncharacterized protein